MAGLEQLPVLGWEAKKEIVPSNVVLLPEESSGLGSEDGGLNVMAVLMPELVKAGLKNRYDVRVGVFLGEVLHKRGKVLFPGDVGMFGAAKDNMEAIFRLTTAGTGIVPLFSPLVECDTNTAVF